MVTVSLTKTEVLLVALSMTDAVLQESNSIEAIQIIEILKKLRGVSRSYAHKSLIKSEITRIQTKYNLNKKKKKVE